jgi:GntR family transcriptional repressor for pyruvate dehydrogenase complex
MAQTLSGTLVEALRTRIVNGDIAPGEKLPSEPRLSAEHGVSRTVVREAIARLNLEGLVHTRRGSGSYALTPPAADADGGARPLARSLEDRLALVEYRLALEAEAAALAAARRTPAQLAALADRLDALASSDGHPATAMQHDFAFHRLVAEASANRFLLEALDRLGPQMIAMPPGRLDRHGRDAHDSTARGSTSRDSNLDDGARFAAVVQEHRAILASLETQDPLAAAAAMRVHLTGSRRRLLQESGRPTAP